MNRKVTAVVLSLVLLVSTAACGKNISNEYGNKAAMSEIDFSEAPVTITYLTIGDKPSNGRTEEVIDRLNQILLKNLNARLDIYYIGWTDYLNNYNNALESENASIDLIGTSTDWLDAWPNIVEGNFMPLSEDLLRKYCGITYANVSSSEWEDCSYDEKIYMIPENEYTQWTNHGFIYREDIAKKAGLTEVGSWNDITKYFKYVSDNYPEMIPWDYDGKSAIATLGYFMSSMKYVPIYELTTYGIWGAEMDDSDKIFSPYYTGDEFVEYARLMKKWNEIGVFRDDVSNAGDNIEEFYAGTSSVIQHHTENYYTTIEPTSELRMPEAETGFFWFGKESGNLMKVSALHGAMAVSAYSRNPERALMVYDMLRNNEECYRLIRYGIEGVQYEINANNMIEKPSGYNEEEDSIVTNFWWGRRDDFEIPDASYAWDEYYELVDSYERVAIDYPWDGVPFSTPGINSQLPEVISIFDRYMPLISTGKYTQPPEDMVAQFREELKNAGFERITGNLQRIYNSNK